ncbi:TonB system transport protein ExbD, partial [bacterium M00.F.Ca.ET.222.01.1.1]
DGELMEVMNLLRAAGYLKVALVGLETASGTGSAAPAGGAPAASGGAAQATAGSASQ